MSYNNKVLIITDSNFLYSKHDKKADFNIFQFNSNFENLRSAIEASNLEEKIVLGISDVVLEELMIQKLESHERQISTIKHLINDFAFPNYNMHKLEDNKFNYLEYLRDKKDVYINSLNKGVIEYIIIPIPNQIRFSSIIKRAFEKRPPFEGVNGKSDKGFKDALFWESILELKLRNDISDVIVCTSDKRMINNELITEYSKVNQTVNLNIVSIEKVFSIIQLITENEGSTYIKGNFDEDIKSFIESNLEWRDEIPFSFYLEDLNNSGYLKSYNIELINEVSTNNYSVVMTLTINVTDANKNSFSKKVKYMLNLRYAEGIWFYIDYVSDWGDSDEQLAST